ncbi:MAG: sulfurtransferase TusA family protein [Acidiferrobacterales bacterium]
MAKSIFLTMFDFYGLSELLGLSTSERTADMAWVTGQWVEIPNYGCLYVVRSLNFIGETCLRTNMVTKQALTEVKRGDIIEIVTDNLSSIETIHFMSPNYSGTHLVTYRDAKFWKVYVQKDAAIPQE